jgi:hypothetical protein
MDVRVDQLYRKRMAKPLVSDELWSRIRNHFRAQDGHAVGVRAPGVGLRKRHDAVEAARGMGAFGALAEIPPSTARRARARRTDRLVARRHRLRQGRGKKGARRSARTRQIEPVRAASTI